MNFLEMPIGELVGKCSTWNPKVNGSGKFDYIDLSSVDKDEKEITTVEQYPCSEAPSRARQLVKENDVLVATVRPNLNGVAIVGEEHDGMTASTGYCVLRPIPEHLDPRFLFHWVKTGVFVKRMVDVASGANYPAVSDAKVKASTIPLPSLDEQKRIAEVLDAADALRAKRREALVQLDTFLQSTFYDLFGDLEKNSREWNQVSFGDCTSNSFRNGLSPSNKGTVEGEVLTLSAITGCQFSFHQRKLASFDKAPSYNQCLMKNTFLICRGNGNKRLVGVGRFPDRDADDVCFPDTMIGATIDPLKITYAYLEVVWSSYVVRRQIERGARTTNGTYKVNQKLLSSVLIPLPPIDLQGRFAAIAESVEQQKARMHAHLTELDALFASLQHRAFNGEL